MTKEIIIVICVVVAFCSVLIAEALKKIIQCIFKKKGRQLDMKKLEYPLASMPIVLTFVTIFLVLFFASDMELYDILKLAAVFATSTQTIYTFVIQTARKGIEGCVTEIKKINTRMKDKKALHDNAKGIIDAMDESNAETETETFDSFLEGISKGK